MRGPRLLFVFLVIRLFSFFGYDRSGFCFWKFVALEVLDLGGSRGDRLASFPNRGIHLVGCIFALSGSAIGRGSVAVLGSCIEVY